MRRFLVAAALSIIAGLTLASAPAWSQKAAAVVHGKFGALAVDRGQGFIFGFAYDHPSRAAANQFAMDECKKRKGNCALVVEFAGEGCASYHTISATDGSAYGWGTATTREAAQARSLQECNNFGGGKACTNHVWACNSKDAAAFKVLRSEPVKPKAAATDCLVQFSVPVDMDGQGEKWAIELDSPVYRLSAKDCPLATKSVYHGFHHNVFNGKVDQSESNAEKKNPALQAKGFAMAEAFYNWLMPKPLPFRGVHYRSAVSVTVTEYSDAALQDMVEDVGSNRYAASYWADGPRSAGLCPAYVPPGVTPVSVHGLERCTMPIK